MISSPALRPRGLRIGNLTSQFFANVYLNPLDHFVKEDLRVRAFARYCDDLVVFGRSREHLRGVRRRISRFPLKNAILPDAHLLGAELEHHPCTRADVRESIAENLPDWLSLARWCLEKPGAKALEQAKAVYEAGEWQ